MSTFQNEIRERAVRMSESRSKRFITNDIRKTQNGNVDSLRGIREIKNIKRNLKKASERILREKKAAEKTLFTELHEKIITGEAKETLKSGEHSRRWSEVDDIPKILGVSKKNGSLYFIIKWTNSVATERVPAKRINIAFPQKVLAFYEAKITWRD